MLPLLTPPVVRVADRDREGKPWWRGSYFYHFVWTAPCAWHPHDFKVHGPEVHALVHGYRVLIYILQGIYYIFVFIHKSLCLAFNRWTAAAFAGRSAKHAFQRFRFGWAVADRELWAMADVLEPPEEWQVVAPADEGSER